VSLKPNGLFFCYAVARPNYISMRCSWCSLCSRHIWIFIVLTHRHISLHSDTLSWFRNNQYFLLLNNDVCLAKKYEIVFGLAGPRIKPTI